MQALLCVLPLIHSLSLYYAGSPLCVTPHSLSVAVLCRLSSVCYPSFTLCHCIMQALLCVLPLIHSLWLYYAGSPLRVTPNSLSVTVLCRLSSVCYPSFTLCGCIMQALLCVLPLIHSLSLYYAGSPLCVIPHSLSVAVLCRLSSACYP